MSQTSGDQDPFFEIVSPPAAAPEQLEVIETLARHLVETQPFTLVQECSFYDEETGSRLRLESYFEEGGLADTWVSLELIRECEDDWDTFLRVDFGYDDTIAGTAFRGSDLPLHIQAGQDLLASSLLSPRAEEVVKRLVNLAEVIADGGSYFDEYEYRQPLVSTANLARLITKQYCQGSFAVERVFGHVKEGRVDLEVESRDYFGPPDTRLTPPIYEIDHYEYSNLSVAYVDHPAGLRYFYDTDSDSGRNLKVSRLDEEGDEGDLELGLPDGDDDLLITDSDFQEYIGQLADSTPCEPDAQKIIEVLMDISMENSSLF